MNIPKEFTVTATRWQLLKARIFGEKYHDRSGTWEIIAYRYKGKFYITSYGRTL